MTRSLISPRRWALALAFASTCAVPLAHAVSINPRGTGQVLIYPYYTVNGGQQTLITIGNDSGRGKAVRVRFSEGRNGRTVLAFNLYLAPRDVWSGAIFQSPSSEAAALLTDDDSCTFPLLKTSTLVQQLPDGRRYIAFFDYAYGYRTSPEDAGPDGLGRTREGYIEAIEMGSIETGSTLATAVSPGADGTPKDCSSLEERWNGGDWSTNPNLDLANPTGGLYGGLMVVNVAAGTLFSVPATAIEDFRVDPRDEPRGSTSSVVLHRMPIEQAPLLSDAVTDPVLGTAAADVDLGGRNIHVEYPSGSRGIDAVTAVLMSSTVAGDYVLEAAAGASTEWILTMPTRRFYVDEAIVGSSAIAPFTRVYPKSGAESSACMAVPYVAYGRNARQSSAADPQILLCFGAQALPFSMTNVAAPADVLGSSLVAAASIATDQASGMAQLMTGSHGSPTAFAMRPADDGTVLKGLPVMGFVVFDYINSNVQAGVLANYSGAVPLRSSTVCARDGAACP